MGLNDRLWHTVGRPGIGLPVRAKSVSAISVPPRVPSDPFGTSPRHARRGRAPPVSTYADIVSALPEVDLNSEAVQNANNFGYDLSGRLIEKTDALNRSSTFAYDRDGHVTQVVTARGTTSPTPASGTITNAYDNRGRLTSVDYGDATPDVSFGYDDAGQRTTMGDGQGPAVAYTYDSAGRLTDVGRSGQPGFGYRYDAEGHVTNRSYPDATQVAAVFDREGNLQQVSEGGRVTSFGYDPAGRLVSATLPSTSGLTESRTYDRAGRLTEVKNQGGSGVVSQFDRAYDPVGNPVRVDTTRGSLVSSEVMGYDAQDRLTNWCQGSDCQTAAGQITYTYDPVGNRTRQVRAGAIPAPGTVDYTYDAADQLTQSTTGGVPTAYAYDADGNQTAAGTRTSTYDLAGRMTSTSDQGVSTVYAFDGDGNRLTRSTGGTVDTRFEWDTNSSLPELAIERDGAGAVARRYVQGPVGPVSMAVPTGPFTPDGVYYYLRDPIGSVTDLTDAMGVSVARYGYEPFGAPLTPASTSGPVNPVGFTGEYTDPTGDISLRARQYNPASGMFSAVDPVAGAVSAPGVSRYVYVGGMPGVLVDPSGMISCRSPGAGASDSVMASWRSCVQTENEQDAVDGAAQDRAANERLASRTFNTVLDYAPVTGQIRAAARWSGAAHYADTQINDPEARYQYSKDRLKAEATDAALLTAGDAVALAAGKLGAAFLRSGAGRAITERLGTGAQRLCTLLADETGSFNPFTGGRAAKAGGKLDRLAVRLADETGAIGRYGNLGKLADRADETAADVIRSRGGGASQIKQLQTGTGNSLSANCRTSPSRATDKRSRRSRWSSRLGRKARAGVEMNADVQRLAADSGELIAITGLMLPADRFVALAFRFAAGTLLLHCDNDTDEILVDVIDDDSHYEAVVDEFLTSLTGSTIEYAWVLTNHRGYEDAFQIRLAGADNDVTVQFEVGASAMDMRRVVG